MSSLTFDAVFASTLLSIALVVAAKASELTQVSEPPLNPPSEVRLPVPENRAA